MALRHWWGYHSITRFNLKPLILIPTWYISNNSLDTEKSHMSQMQNITTHFWVGSVWLNHLMEYDSQLWLGSILTDDHASEREKDDQQKTIKRERKENLICYMSGPWNKGKQGNKKPHKRISKDFIKCTDYTKK